MLAYDLVTMIINYLDDLCFWQISFQLILILHILNMIFRGVKFREFTREVLGLCIHVHTR